MFSEKEEKVYAMQKYILSHLYENLTLKNLAARTDLSEWQCYRSVTNRVPLGQSPHHQDSVYKEDAKSETG